MMSQSERAHSQAVGLPEFPRLIFLDTNVVENLYSFGQFICEGLLSTEMEQSMLDSGPEFTDDIYALAHIMHLGSRAGWPLATSPGTQNELGDTREPGKRYALIECGNELADYFAYNRGEPQVEVQGPRNSEIPHFISIQRTRMSDLLKALPQERDRRLFIDALELGCDIFLTMDYRTIWRRRGKVKEFGIKIMRPVELFEYVRPWAGLLR